MKPHVEEILAVEIEERELNTAQKQLEKAENLVKNKDAGRQVPYRPQRTNWFSEKREAERAGKCVTFHQVLPDKIFVAAVAQAFSIKSPRKIFIFYLLLS